MSTTKALRIALFASAFCATWTTADAKPRRVVVLDFDGPRTLADNSHASTINVLGESYDVVASKRWLDAKAEAARKKHGPELWAKASKETGVDAVIEGWVQDEGRSKVLTVVVTDASNGTAFDQLTIRLGAKGVAGVEKKLKDGLEERFAWIEPVNPGNPDPLPEHKVKDRRLIGSKRTDDGPAADDAGDRDAGGDDQEQRPRSKRRRDRDRDRASDDRDDERPARRDRDDDDVTEKTPRRVAKIETKQTKEQKETSVLATVFRPVSEEEDIVTGGKASHVPKATEKFHIGGGFGYGSRTLYIGAENPDGVTQYASVPHKSLGVSAQFYPFPTQKIDGILSGIGFSFAIDHSIGSTVTFDNLDTVGDYAINAFSWSAAIHYRTPLGGAFALDGEVGYGHSSYIIVDAPMEFEVPDTGYQYLSAGGTLDLKITERSSVGFGAKYLYTLATGDLSSTDWYGPGGSAGFELAGNFVIPLPSNLYVRGDLTYQRIKTSFDGVGEITEPEGVTEAIDSTIAGSVKVGIRF